MSSWRISNYAKLGKHKPILIHTALSSSKHPMKTNLFIHRMRSVSMFCGLFNWLKLWKSGYGDCGHSHSNHRNKLSTMEIYFHQNIRPTHSFVFVFCRFDIPYFHSVITLWFKLMKMIKSKCVCCTWSGWMKHICHIVTCSHCIDIGQYHSLFDFHLNDNVNLMCFVAIVGVIVFGNIAIDIYF